MRRLWCLLVIIAFSMPVFAATPPYQIDSFDDINDTNWVETTAGGDFGSYMEQELVGGANEVNEGAGSMKFDFTQYVWPDKDDEVKRTFSPALDFNNYKELAITLWDWTEDPNDSGILAPFARLKEIALYDGSAFDRVGRFTVLPLKNVGWNKVIAPLRNFIWKAGVTDIDPNVVDWNDITKIGLWARTEGDDPNDSNNPIYLDDLRLEWAPPQPNMPYQVASFDDINDEAWVEDHGRYSLMLQSDANMEGTGSMMLDYDNHGIEDWDLTPIIRLVPALDFTDGNDWAITLWVWTDLVLDSYLWEVTLHDVCGNTGRNRVPRADINDLNGYGWNKITVRVDELLWSDSVGGNFVNKTASECCLDAIVAIELWTMSYPFWGNTIYLDDLRIETAVEALSEAVVYNADYTPVELTIDANAEDWADLVDSEPIDFDLATINFTPPPDYPTTPSPGTWNHTGSGDLHVKYRLAWDPNYLYILIEEQSGDNLAKEAADLEEYVLGAFDYAGTYYDGLALAFDFTNNRIPGQNTMLGVWLYFGLSSGDPGPTDPGRTDLLMALLNTVRGVHEDAPVANAVVATTGSLGSRVIEARLLWSELDSAIDSWFQPAGGIEAAIQAGYIFGCDPRLLDTEDISSPWNATHGMGWFSGIDYAVGWPQGYHRWPTGRDTFSIDIRLVCSAGDLDFDCDVDFVDYAQFAAKWLDSDCNNVNDFCNGADIIINGAVTSDDLDRFTERWLDGF